MSLIQKAFQTDSILAMDSYKLFLAWINEASLTNQEA
jgi:hypothetical protein